MREIAQPANNVRTPTNAASVSVPILQRKCACGGTPGASGECEACRQKRTGLVQRKAIGVQGPGFAPPQIRDVLSSFGQALDPATQALMESRLGHDFSHVRIHTDSKAADSAWSVNALAYTVGRDVVFGTGQYTPATSEGRKLLAHELTHVIQQESKSTGMQPASVTVLNSDPHERAADAAASSISAGQSIRLSPGSAGIGLQRQPARGISRQEIEKCILKWEKEPEEMSILAAEHFAETEIEDTGLNFRWATVQCEINWISLSRGIPANDRQSPCTVTVKKDGPTIDVEINRNTRSIFVGHRRASGWGGYRFCFYDYDGCNQFNRHTPNGVPILTLKRCGFI